jgi:hypothetical protein
MARAAKAVRVDPVERIARLGEPSFGAGPQTVEPVPVGTELVQAAQLAEGAGRDQQPRRGLAELERRRGAENDEGGTREEQSQGAHPD